MLAQAMKPPPAGHRAADRHKHGVHVVALGEAGAQAAELVPQGDRLLDDKAEDAQPAAVPLAQVGDGRGDASAGEGRLTPFFATPG